MEKILSKINIVCGFITVALSSMFGKYWWLFVAFLVLNVVDYVTGVMKAKFFHVENSCKGLTGILKKVGYWIVIAMAFFISISFKTMGETIGINLSFVVLFGWFTLATFIINESRSIIENLVAMGVEVPNFLTYGLEVASKMINEKIDNDKDI